MNLSVADYDMQGWFVVLFALLIALIAGLWRFRSRGLFASMVMFGALALALIAAALTAAHIPTFLFVTFDARNAQADDSWKAAQTIVLTLGFIGIVITGVLGYHRQRTSQEQLALERRSRQHERYAKGSEMLASETSEMRIAGLNVIALLGAEVAIDDQLRQTCINSICAYLRKNSPADHGGPAPSKRSSRPHRAEKIKEMDKYRVVAEEACRLLPSLLAPIRARRRWQFSHLRSHRGKELGLNLDLRGAEVIDLDMSGRVMGTTIFSGATFTGRAWFERATFTGDAEFYEATFTAITTIFSGATFTKSTSFDSATFTGNAWFEGATFTGNARFEDATFAQDALFNGARFSGVAAFKGASFVSAGPDSRNLTSAIFERDTPFDGAAFGQ